MIIDNLSRIAIYFNPRFTSYRDKITPCAITVRPKELGAYYLDFTSKFYYNLFDEKGIPVYNRSQEYHPTDICQYAFGAYELLHKSRYQDKIYSNIFLKQADWLVNNSTEIDCASGWNFNFELKEYNLKNPWFSALTQGEAISVLLRAYLIDKEEKYLKKALAAMNLFEVNVEEGGIINYMGEDPVFEEYPSSKVNFVLNGFIFALFGLFDFILFDNSTQANNLFTKGVKTIKKILPQFDTGYWSQYNLFEKPQIYLASFKYHLIHIEQLKALSYITGDSMFLEYSKKWEKYSSTLLKRMKALVKKLLQITIFPLIINALLIHTFIGILTIPLFMDLQELPLSDLI